MGEMEKGYMDFDIKSVGEKCLGETQRQIKG
jgi:hypothetical protein